MNAIFNKTRIINFPFILNSKPIKDKVKCLLKIITLNNVLKHKIDIRNSLIQMHIVITTLTITSISILPHHKHLIKLVPTLISPLTITESLQTHFEAKISTKKSHPFSLKSNPNIPISCNADN